MKTPVDITRAIEKRLTDTWPSVVLAEQGVAPAAPSACVAADDAPIARPPRAHDDAGRAPSAPWPRSFPLGRESSAAIAADFGRHVRTLQQWRDWVSDRGLVLKEEPRSIAGTAQQQATHVIVGDIDTAVAAVGDGWPERLAVARSRTAEILSQSPAAAADSSLPRVLRSAVGLSDLDFDILCRVAHWFCEHPREAVQGLTPRQVPLAGVHAKWLNKNQSLVAVLAGLDDLGLLPGHPPRVHFTYLDPDYLATGRRRHDSYSVGDAVELPYRPRVVLISENKDTAVGFPPLPGGVAVEGAGTGGGTIAAVDWIREADLVVYWGDMDADGLQILNEFRAVGLTTTSMLMNLDTYRAYHQFGTNHAPNGQPLKVAKPGPLLHLDHREHELLEHLTSGTAPVLRIEQERIPLHVAESELSAIFRR